MLQLVIHCRLLRQNYTFSNIYICMYIHTHTHTHTHAHTYIYVYIHIFFVSVSFLSTGSRRYSLRFLASFHAALLPPGDAGGTGVSNDSGARTPCFFAKEKFLLVFLILQAFPAGRPQVLGLCVKLTNVDPPHTCAARRSCSTTTAPSGSGLVN